MSFACLCRLQSGFNRIDEHFQIYLESLNYQQPVFPILSLSVCVNVLFWEKCVVLTVHLGLFMTAEIHSETL